MDGFALITSAATGAGDVFPAFVMHEQHAAAPPLMVDSPAQLP